MPQIRRQLDVLDPGGKTRGDLTYLTLTYKRGRRIVHPWKWQNEDLVLFEGNFEDALQFLAEEMYRSGLRTAKTAPGGPQSAEVPPETPGSAMAVLDEILAGVGRIEAVLADVAKEAEQMPEAPQPDKTGEPA